MVTRNDLEAILAASPRDDAAYLVYGDWLQAHGDPRGELIAIDDAARRAPPEERRAWRARRDDLLARHPELAPPPSRDATLGWHLGFVRSVSLGNSYDESLRVPEGLFDHPALAFVSELVLPAGVAIDHLVGALARVPATLRTLAVGELDRPRSGRRHEPLDLDHAFEAHPQLEHVFAGAAVTFTWAPERLRSLELGDGSRETFARLAAVELDMLETLVVHVGPSPLFARTDPPPLPRMADLRPLLAAPLPRLTTLALLDVPYGDELVTELAGAAVLRRLRVLRLWNAGLTMAGARAITKPAFGHLELLDLWDAGVDEAVERMLADVCQEVRLVPPRLRALVRV